LYRKSAIKELKEFVEHGMSRVLRIFKGNIDGKIKMLCVFVWQMSGQMLQLQSREEKERDKLQQFADTVDSSSSQQQSSSSEQLLDVVQ